MSDKSKDVIDQLVGVVPGSALDAVRNGRPTARDNAQKSYEALFAPADPGTVSLSERFALASFVAGLHRDAEIGKFYGSQLAALAEANLVAAVGDEARRGETSGPYGRYPDGPLSAEDAPGIHHRVADANRRALGERLSAALEHAHLLVFRPRDSSSAALQALLDAGWSTTEIVTISQLVAFLAFQIRVVIGLRALAEVQQNASVGYATTPISPVAAA
jgi:CMD domain protein